TANLPAISYTPAGAVSVVLADGGHTHAIADVLHGHTLHESPHVHGIDEHGGHSHTLTHPRHAPTYNLYTTNAAQLGGGFAAQTAIAGSGQLTSTAPTGISINNATTGLAVVPASTGITADAAFSGITTTQVQGANVSVAGTGFTGAPASL